MTQSVSRRSFVVSSLALALSVPVLTRHAAAAAQDSTPSSSPASASGLDTLGLPTLNITITADGFEGVPSSLPAGRYLVAATASDPFVEVDFLQPTGMSVDDFFSALSSAGGGGSASPSADGGTPASGDEGGDSAPPPFFYDFLLAGGVSVIPGGNNQTVLDLAPGDWVAWGGSPEATQQPVTFTVTGEMPATLAEPDATATITFTDFAIDVTAGSLQSGHNILKIENSGAQPHFLDVQKGPDGLTKDQVKAALDTEMTGTPVAGGVTPADFQPIVSTSVQSAGTTTWIAVDLEPGSYAAFCFFPDKETGMPHAYMGMYNVFTVGS